MAGKLPKICVVGAGEWSTRMHLPAIKSLQEGDVAEYPGVCDLDEAKAVRYARALGARAFARLEEMVQALRPDGLALIVNCEATPRLIEFSIAHGIPFLCEKPPTTDAETHRRLLASVGSLPHVVAYNRRHAPYTQRACEWLAGRRLVTVTALFSRHRRREEFSTTAVHAIDTALYLAGDDLVEAEVEVAPGGDGVWNFFVAGWTKKNVRVDVLVTPDTATNEEHYVVRGDERSVRMIFPHHSTVDFPGGLELFERQRCVARLGPERFGIAEDDAPRLAGIHAEHELFAKLIRGQAGAISTLATSLPTQEICDLLRNRQPHRLRLSWRFRS